MVGTYLLVPGLLLGEQDFCGHKEELSLQAPERAIEATLERGGEGKSGLKNEWNMSLLGASMC